MNEIVNKFLLAGDKFIQDNLNLPIMLVDSFLETKKEYKNLKKQEIQDVFIKMS